MGALHRPRKHDARIRRPGCCDVRVFRRLWCYGRVVRNPGVVGLSAPPALGNLERGPLTHPAPLLAACTLWLFPRALHADPTSANVGVEMKRLVRSPLFSNACNNRTHEQPVHGEASFGWPRCFQEAQRWRDRRWCSALRWGQQMPDDNRVEVGPLGVTQKAGEERVMMD